MRFDYYHAQPPDVKIEKTDAIASALFTFHIRVREIVRCIPHRSYPGENNRDHIAIILIPFRRDKSAIAYRLTNRSPEGSLTKIPGHHQVFMYIRYVYSRECCISKAVFLGELFEAKVPAELHGFFVAHHATK